MPYSSSDIFWRSSPILVCGIRCVRSGVLWSKPLITTAEPLAFPHPRSSLSLRDGWPHILPLPWCLQRCVLPFRISGGRSVPQPGSGLQGRRQPGPGTRHLLPNFSVTVFGEEVTGSMVLSATPLPPARPTTLPMQIHSDRLGSDRPLISSLVLPCLMCLLNLSVAA